MGLLNLAVVERSLLRRSSRASQAVARGANGTEQGSLHESVFLRGKAKCNGICRAGVVRAARISAKPGALGRTRWQQRLGSTLIKSCLS